MVSFVLFLGEVDQCFLENVQKIAMLIEVNQSVTHIVVWVAGS